MLGSLSRSIAVLGLLALAGCPEKKATQTEAPAFRPDEVTSYVIAPSASSTISWETTRGSMVGGVTYSNPGTFARFSGTVTLTGGKVESARIHLEVGAGSVTTKYPPNSDEMKELLEPGHYPDIVFDATDVAPDGTVTGNLSLHGLTRSVTVHANLTPSPDKLGIHFQVTPPLDKWNFKSPSFRKLDVAFDLEAPKGTVAALPARPAPVAN